MPRHYRKKSHKIKKSRKNRTRRHYSSFRKSKNVARGPDSPMSPTGQVECCMCEKTVRRDTTLVPLECLNKYGVRAHRICQQCWWDPEHGFAKENELHKCPGCVKKIKLTRPLKSKPINPEDIIEISD